MKTTTTFKAMMAMAFATIAMTANAAPKNNTWRNPAPAYHVEVRNDNRNHRHYDTHWNKCNHNHLDRYGNHYFCHTCGAEMVWKGNTRTGHYEVIPPRPTVIHHGGAPIPPTPNHKNHR